MENTTKSEIILDLSLPGLTRENIFKMINEEDIYKYYYDAQFGDGKFQINKKLLSPFREESNPSIYFFMRNDDRIYWKDWGDAEGKVSDVFDYIQKLYNCNYFEALNYINKDLGLGLGKMNYSELENFIKPPCQNKTSAKKDISYNVRRFFIQDIKYWEKQYGIKLYQLEDYNIFPVSEVFLNGELIMINTGIKPIYVYKLEEDTFKIYAPYGPIKWLSNGGGKFIWGLDKIPKNGNILIMTKSLKDLIVYNNLGFYAIAFQTENFILDKNIYEDLYNRFNNLVLIYDNDDPGIKAAEKFKERFPKTNVLRLPKYKSCKDIADLRKVIDNEKLKELFSKYLYNSIYK